MSKEATIYITTQDQERLAKLIEFTRERNNGSSPDNLNKLEQELDRANVVEPKDIPPDVITMRSTVRLKDLNSGEEMVYWLAFPTEANFDEGKTRRCDRMASAVWPAQTESGRSTLSAGIGRRL